MENIAYNLYRVSTTKQVDKTKDDIPMQREACREFAQRMGWIVGKEFLEKGVSGFKVSATDRDAIQELKAAAIRQEFNILLVFMFDRIGRIDDETPFVVEWFVKHGIRVWSVQEGEQRFESHVDKLMNYIRFWQASGESEKTSIRIKTRMKQLTMEGQYTGGSVPFGYQLARKGRLNKRGKEVYDLVVDPVEAEWIVCIFEKTVKEGCGSYQLADYLNSHGIRTHSGAKFQCNTIIRILRNRLTCGYMVSGETVSPHMKELQIVDEKLFEKAQFILDQRMRKNNDKRKITLKNQSRSLLSGIMFCAHCGGRITSDISKDSYTTKDGTTKHTVNPRYRCYHKCNHICKCDGQTVYSAAKVDSVVINIIRDMLSRIGDEPDETEFRKEFDKHINICKAKLTKLKAELNKNRTQYDKLNEEIANTLIGESFYSPEQLSAAMTRVQQNIVAIESQIENINIELDNKKQAVRKLKPMYEQFKGWAEEFDLVPTEQKKMIISQLISRIEIGKGYKISIQLNMDYEQFCEGWMNKEKEASAICPIHNTK